MLFFQILTLLAPRNIRLDANQLFITPITYAKKVPIVLLTLSRMGNLQILAQMVTIVLLAIIGIELKIVLQQGLVNIVLHLGALTRTRRYIEATGMVPNSSLLLPHLVYWDNIKMRINKLAANQIVLLGFP